jgi:hypothetical protein
VTGWTIANLDLGLTVKLAVMVVLYLFLPFTALSYYLFRRHRREAEIKRVLNILNVDADYQKAYQDVRPGAYFLWTVLYASLVSCLGLTLVFFSSEIGLYEFPAAKLGAVSFPLAGSRLVTGMAFLGAYLWSLQYLFRRYGSNDLYPSAYYVMSIRMILAGVVTLLIYNGYQALSGGHDSSTGITANIWPALALLIGMFPQTALLWLTDRLPMFAPKGDASVPPAPLEMIEGITANDRVRLEELGIETCYDLALTDFVPLVLKTPYGPREIVDWILQAKLVAYFGEAVKELRRQGVRTVGDLMRLEDQEIEELPPETTLTRSALKRARESLKEDAEIDRLLEASRRLSQFWRANGDLPAKSASASRP